MQKGIAAGRTRHNERKPWLTPAVRIVTPVARTEGGGGTANDQDDVKYDVGS